MSPVARRVRKLRSSFSSLTARLPRYAERRHAGTKVVNGHAQSEILEAVWITSLKRSNSLMMVVSVIFEDQRRGAVRLWRGELRLNTDLLNPGSRRFVAETFTDTVKRPTLGVPGVRIASTASLEDESGQGAHQPGLLGEWNEVQRWDLSPSCG